MVESVEPPHTKTKVSMRTYGGSIKEEDEERDKIFIS
jgi:hypothetical protein